MFCVECGRRLVDGRCPVHGPWFGTPGVPTRTERERTVVRAVMVTALGVLVAGLGVVSVLAFMNATDAARRAEEVAARLPELEGSVAEQSLLLEQLRGRIERLARGLQARFDPAGIAERARPAVFLVETSVGQGSGFVVRASPGGSTLVTGFHVVRDAWVAGASVTVRQGDRTYRGSIVEISQAEDLALISVPARLPALALSRRPPDVGEEVVVVGYPLGLEHTVATGVVSGTRDRYLQISAPVSPGDSGAPVLDASGKVVGVVVSKFVDVYVEGISFAVPADTVCRTVLRC